METWREELYHYAKGSTAKDHKYIRKEGNRYIYKEDEKSGSGTASVYRRDDTPVSTHIAGPITNIVPVENGFRPTNGIPEDKIKKLQAYLNSQSKIMGFSSFEDMVARGLEGIGGIDRNQLKNMFNTYTTSIDWDEVGKAIGVTNRKLTSGERSLLEEIVMNIFMSAYSDPKYGKNRNNDVKQSDTYTKELYHTAIGGTLIITRR